MQNSHSACIVSIRVTLHDHGFILHLAFREVPQACFCHPYGLFTISSATWPNMASDKPSIALRVRAWREAAFSSNLKWNHPQVAADSIPRLCIASIYHCLDRLNEGPGSGHSQGYGLKVRSRSSQSQQAIAKVNQRKIIGHNRKVGHRDGNAATKPPSP